MTIYDIKDRTRESAPYFFSRNTLKFFHQTMRSFHVKKQSDGRYYIHAPMLNFEGMVVGKTERYFNPVTNELERR